MIRSDAIYTLSELQKELGAKEATVRSMRKNGLPVFYASKQGMVRGADFFEWIGQQSTNPPGSKAGEQPEHLRQS